MSHAPRLFLSCGCAPETGTRTPCEEALLLLHAGICFLTSYICLVVLQWQFTPMAAGPVSNRPQHMRNSPASGWTRAPPQTPPPPPPQRPAGAGALGQPLANRDARLPLQPFRAPYNPLGKEGAALGDLMADPPLAPELARPRPPHIPGPSRDAMLVEMALPMTHPMPGSMGFGSALSYASSYLMDANLGLSNGPQTVLNTLQLGSLSTDLGGNPTDHSASPYMSFHLPSKFLILVQHSE